MSVEEGKWPRGQLSPDIQGQGKTRESARGRVTFVGITSFLFRQGLACLSLLSVESTGINHHAWFTHMILDG